MSSLKRARAAGTALVATAPGSMSGHYQVTTSPGTGGTWKAQRG